MNIHDRSTRLDREKKRYAPARSSGSLYHKVSLKAAARRIAAIVKGARRK